MQKVSKKNKKSAKSALSHIPKSITTLKKIEELYRCQVGILFQANQVFRLFRPIMQRILQLLIQMYKAHYRHTVIPSLNIRWIRGRIPIRFHNNSKTLPIFPMCSRKHRTDRHLFLKHRQSDWCTYRDNMQPRLEIWLQGRIRVDRQVFHSICLLVHLYLFQLFQFQTEKRTVL